MSNHLNRISLLAEKYPTLEHYPYNLPVLSETKNIVFDTPVTFFVGSNGTGKSTVLKALAIACGIYIWGDYESSRYEVNRYEKTLHKYLKLDWNDGQVPGSFFGAQIFKHFANLVDEWAANDPGQLKYFGGKSLVNQSHGQSLMSFFRNRYKIKGLYLLDEPETALSPTTQLELLKLMIENSKSGHAQFIVASHSPILLACPNARIYSFDHCPLKTVDYEDTEHYKVYRDFLMDYKAFI